MCMCSPRVVCSVHLRERERERQVVLEFAELLAHSTELWELVADALIDGRDEPGELTDYLVTALRAS